MSNITKSNVCIAGTIAVLAVWATSVVRVVEPSVNATLAVETVNGSTAEYAAYNAYQASYGVMALLPLYILFMVVIIFFPSKWWGMLTNNHAQSDKTQDV